MIDSRITKAIEYGLDIANNNYHGYSQSRRGDRDKDCSKLVLDALDNAGFNIGTATYTGNMLKPLLALGFIDVAPSINMLTGAGLLYGDILLRPATTKKGGHTAFGIGNGQIIQAQSDYDGLPGDSSGNEIRIFHYYDSPFKYVLRFPGLPEVKIPSDLKVGDIVTINGPGYATSYAEGLSMIIKGTGKIINIYEDGRKTPYAVNYTNIAKSWVDRFFAKSSLKGVL